MVLATAGNPADGHVGDGADRDRCHDDVASLDQRGPTLTAYVWAADTNAGKRVERAVYEYVAERVGTSDDDLAAYPIMRVIGE